MMEEITTEELLEELEIIYDYVSVRYNKDDGSELSQRITDLNIHLARSAVLLSSAQYFFDKAQGNEAERLAQEQREDKIKISPTVFKQLINGRTVNEAKILKLCERLNRTITHQVDGIRSQLSYLKSTY